LLRPLRRLLATYGAEDREPRWIEIDLNGLLESFEWLDEGRSTGG
jgi:hypothetical protein